MERDINQINVVPLVDVMLVLLVIVLTTATFISTGQVPVNLAKAKEASSRSETPIVVTVTAEGGLFLNDRAVVEGGLPPLLQPYPKESPVVVRADRVTLLERFVSIVDEIRSLGFRQVSLEVVKS
jgi:biopolymer transport protein ExbD